MKDKDKSQEQLVNELLEMRQRIAQLESAETARGQAEHALRESEAKYRSLTDDVLDGSMIGIFILDADFRVVWVNQALERYFGVQREAIIGHDKRQLIRERIKHIFEDPASFADRVLATYDDNTYAENFECHVHPDGQRQDRWLEHWSQPIRSGLYAGGRIEHYADITQRKRAHAALRESEERLRRIIENTDAGYFRIGRDGRWEHVNQSWLRMHGYDSPDEVLGQHFALTQVQVDLEEAQRFVEKLLDGEPIPIGEFTRRRKDGSIGYHTFSTSPVMRGGEAVGLEGFIIDITDRKRAEEALQAHSERLEEIVEERTQALCDAQEQLVRQERLAVLGQLSGGIAHELRNPLGAISNSAYFLNLALKEPDPKVKNALDILEREVRTCAGIISSLLDFARGRPPARREVDLKHIVHGAISRTPIPENIKVVTRLAEELPTIQADAEQLEQVFGNLILNALQAMTLPGKKPGGGQLLIQAKVRGPGWVSISFTDTGVGIAQENLEKIFEPLFTTRSRGIGLGLALVKMLVEGHGGSIQVESVVGQGSAFTVKLPLF
jgi:PAS domain S-box-containing protein